MLVVRVVLAVDAVAVGAVLPAAKALAIQLQASRVFAVALWKVCDVAWVAWVTRCVFPRHSRQQAAVAPGMVTYRLKR